MFEIQYYEDPDGVNLFTDWLMKLRDDEAQARILQRLNRLQGGLTGVCRHVGESVWELKIDYGPGYRVYYTRIGPSMLLLLGGGDKRTQPGDIATAIARRLEFLGRAKNDQA